MGTGFYTVKTEDLIASLGLMKEKVLKNHMESDAGVFKGLL